jgi:DNA adenine methylase
LKNADLLASDFEGVLERVRPGDFVYLDPPFSVKARRTFNEYDRSIFGAGDLERLRLCLERLASNGISFLLSYAECDEGEILRNGFYTKVVKVKRNIAGFAERRAYSNELLVSNCLPNQVLRSV